jgi:hypothetical protein
MEATHVRRRGEVRERSRERGGVGGELRAAAVDERLVQLSDAQLEFGCVTGGALGEREKLCHAPHQLVHVELLQPVHAATRGGMLDRDFGEHVVRARLDRGVATVLRVDQSEWSERNAKEHAVGRRDLEDPFIVDLEHPTREQRPARAP